MFSDPMMARIAGDREALLADHADIAPHDLHAAQLTAKGPALPQQESLGPDAGIDRTLGRSLYRKDRILTNG